jgi:hypothetical protein
LKEWKQGILRFDILLEYDTLKLKGKRRNNRHDRREKKRENEGLSQTSNGDLGLFVFSLLPFHYRPGERCGKHTRLARYQPVVGKLAETENDEIGKIES